MNSTLADKSAECRLHWRDILLLALGLGLFSPRAPGQSSAFVNSGIIVNADQMSTDFRAKTTLLSGNVQVAFKGQHLACDRAVIDYRNKRIEASGRVRLQSTSAYAEASRLTLNYEADTAVLEDSFIQSGNVVFEGRQIQKTGPNTFIASEAKYTACASCPPTWSFSGQRIEAELGGYARIRRPVLRIGGIPVIILPGILVPLKSARQSGLLVPSIDYSRTGGLAFGQSFFWAIDRSRDMTLSAKYYELRGLKGLTQYRYVLNEASRGKLEGAFMRDRAVNSEFQINHDVDRWYYQYEHYYNLPDNFIQRVTLRQISDLRYLRDFPEELQGHGDPALENRLSLTKNFYDQHLSAEASYHINLLKSFPLAKNNDAVHRFPQIRYSVVSKRILSSPILFRFDADYNNFTRSQFSYDDMSSVACVGLPHCATLGSEGEIGRDGQFDAATDFLRTGQRIDLRPSLAMPFRLFKVIKTVPQIAYRETLYRFQIDDVFPANAEYGPSAAQRYLEADLAMRTTFARVFGELSSPQSQRWKHEIEPEVVFSTIPWIRRPDHPFFGEFADQRTSRMFEPISDADLYGRNRLQFDYFDRVFDRQLIQFGITNRLIRKRWNNGFPDYGRVMAFRLSQSYDFNEARTEKPQPWSAINGQLNLRLDNFETNSEASYNLYAKVTNTSAKVRIFNTRNNYLLGSYERIYLLNEDNVVTSRNQTENIGVGLGLRSKFLDLEGQVNYSAITNDILSWQNVAHLKPPGNCWTVRIDHKQVIGGEPEFRFNMSFDFGGEQVKRVN